MLQNLSIERRWLSLARRYEFSERLSNFTATPFSGPNPRRYRPLGLTRAGAWGQLRILVRIHGLVLAASAHLRRAQSSIMNASIASPWHRARTPVGNGRNRCSVCQRYLGRQHQRGWTAAACSADNEVLAPNFFSSRARGRGAPRCFVERSLERFYVRQRDGDEPRVVRRCRFLRRSQDSFLPDQKNFRQHCTAPWRGPT